MRGFLISFLLLLCTQTALSFIPDTALTGSDIQSPTHTTKTLYELSDTEIGMVKDFILHIYGEATGTMDCISFGSVYSTIPMAGRNSIGGIYILPSWFCKGGSVLENGILNAIRLYTEQHTAHWVTRSGKSVRLVIKKFKLARLPDTIIVTPEKVYVGGVTLVPLKLLIVEE